MLAERPYTDADIDYAIQLATEWLECRGLSQTKPRHRIGTNSHDYDLTDVQSLAKLFLITKVYGLSEIAAWDPYDQFLADQSAWEGFASKEST